MPSDDISTDIEFQVVINDEEQYSIWPAHRTPPNGWRSVGFRGSKERCIAHIDEVWTDITPRSVREALHR